MKTSTRINQEVIVAAGLSRADARRLAVMKKQGLVIKLAPTVYTTNKNDTPENIVTRNLFYILGELYSGALLSHRYAFEYKPADGGHIFLTYRYTKKVRLQSFTIHLIEGPLALDEDYPFMGGLRVSCQARAYLENLQNAYRCGSVSKCLTREEIEERLERVLQTNGESALNELRDTARSIAERLDMRTEFERLDAIIGALLSTKPAGVLTSASAQARAIGEPFDSNRVNLFNILLAALNNCEFENFPEPYTSDAAYRNFAFFESYFSNYIEGTEFELDDARQIVETQTPLPSRNADSHDVLGTYYIVSNRKEMSIVPSSADQLIDILQNRHQILMSARVNSAPGLFKMQNNRAGETHFVDYNQVRGTLRKGFEVYSALRHPFARAVFMLFMISEVHPFNDGNGRMSRIMMNAELTAAGQSKVIIPNVFRADYLGGLRQLSRRSNPDVLIRSMMRVRLFSSHLQGEDFNVMRDYLEQCNAFKNDDEDVLRF